MAGKLKLSPEVPFAYRPGKTMLHRMSAGVKLLAVIVLSTAAFASLYGLVASIMLVLAFAVAARIPPWTLLKGSRLLVIMSLFIILIKTVQLGAGEINLNPSGFIEGPIIILRIFLCFAAAALMFALTTMRELRLSLARLELAVKNIFLRRRKQAPIAFFSLGICLMLGFIPRFFELWESSNLACEARSAKRGIRRLLILIPLVTELMMESAADTALALEARGLGSA